MRTDTALEVFLFAYDILETQFPKLSKNTVECHSKKRERETKLMWQFCISYFTPFLFFVQEKRWTIFKTSLTHPPFTL